MKIERNTPIIKQVAPVINDERFLTAGLFLSTAASALDQIVLSAGKEPIHKIRKAAAAKEGHLVFKTAGKPLPRGVGVGGINGINNTWSEAREHADKLAEYSGGYQVHWVYNANSGPIPDILKAVGYFEMVDDTPAQLLVDQWNEFFKKNGEKAIYYQECHSQGAAQVLKALQSLDPNLRKRIYIVAIAPSMMIPDELCFQVKHYASSKDWIPGMACKMSAEIIAKENVHRQLEENLFGNSDDLYDQEFYTEFQRQYKRLIFLDPHPKASGLDHEIESETYREIRRQELTNFLKVYG